MLLIKYKSCVPPALSFIEGPGYKRLIFQHKKSYTDSIVKEFQIVCIATCMHRIALFLFCIPIPRTQIMYAMFSFVFHLSIILCYFLLIFYMLFFHWITFLLKPKIKDTIPCYLFLCDKVFLPWQNQCITWQNYIYNLCGNINMVYAQGQTFQNSVDVLFNLSRT